MKPKKVFSHQLAKSFSCKQLALKILVLVFSFQFSVFTVKSYSQVSINASGLTPNSSTWLDIGIALSSGNGVDTKGMLIPRVALTATNSTNPIVPAPGSSEKGLLVFNTSSAGSSPYNVEPGYYFWDGSKWVQLLNGGSPGTAWLTLGNTGSTSSTATIGSTVNGNFIGTTDAKDFVIASYNQERMRITSGGNVGIGTTSPAGPLHVVIPVQPVLSATGGTITYSGGYTIHTFTGSGTFTVTSAPGSSTVDVLVVGAGGNGGGNAGGGGGGGEVTEYAGVGVTEQAYTITVGVGGGGAKIGNNGTNGGTTSALGHTAAGGGGGGYSANGSDGASGGGGGGYSSSYSGGNGSAGHNGGAGYFSSTTYYGGGGGGGAGSNGNSPGCGGSGKTSSYSGSSLAYGAGGAGGNYYMSCCSAASGIGGIGDGNAYSCNFTNGNSNTGSGGGGGQGSSGGIGGSGIVIIRYPTPAVVLPDLLVVKSTGKIGMGTTTPAYTLDVCGDIRATGSVYYGGTCGTANGTAYNKPDYVFESDYKIYTPNEIEKFIGKKGHLPWLTSAKKEKKENNGAVNITRMSFETLEAVENMQLQIIEQQKQIEEMQKKIKRLENK